MQYRGINIASIGEANPGAKLSKAEFNAQAQECFDTMKKACVPIFMSEALAIVNNPGLENYLPYQAAKLRVLAAKEGRSLGYSESVTLASQLVPISNSTVTVQLSESLSSLVDAGKLTPTQQHIVMKLAERLHDAEDIELSEGDGIDSRKAHLTAIDCLKRFIQSFTGTGDPFTIGTIQRSASNRESANLARRASEYQQSEGRKGRDVSIAAAVHHVALGTAA
jgi:hypothetical protein